MFEEKKLSLLGNKLMEKIPDPRNANEHYQSFVRKKNTKLLRQWKIITDQPKSFENPNITDIKSIITKHPKKAEKVCCHSSLYSDAKKQKNFKRKKCKNNKTRKCF